MKQFFITFGILLIGTLGIIYGNFPFLYALSCIALIMLNDKYYYEKEVK